MNHQLYKKRLLFTSAMLRSNIPWKHASVQMGEEEGVYSLRWLHFCKTVKRNVINAQVLMWLEHILLMATHAQKICSHATSTAVHCQGMKSCKSCRESYKFVCNVNNMNQFASLSHSMFILFGLGNQPKELADFELKLFLLLTFILLKFFPQLPQACFCSHSFTLAFKLLRAICLLSFQRPTQAQRYLICLFFNLTCTNQYYTYVQTESEYFPESR